MANREQKTRQKPTFRLPASKPRNPLVVPAMKRAAGAHRKSVDAVHRARLAAAADAVLAARTGRDRDDRDD